MYSTDFSKEPIAPGGKGVIGVQYATDRGYKSKKL
jgi:hypothetical protein